MVASSLRRVVATACARRPASWVTFKSPVIVRHPLHHIRIHPHHRHFLRPTTASSASQPAVTEQADRQAPSCLPSQTQGDDDKEVVSHARHITRRNVVRLRFRATKWRFVREATGKALECLTDTNKSPEDRLKAIRVLTSSYTGISCFHLDIKRQIIHYRDFAAYRSAAVDLVKSAVQAREALEEAQVKLDEAKMELDLAQAQATDPQHAELKAEHVRNRKAALSAREKEFRDADEAVLVSSGIFLNTPSPELRKPAETKREDYEWMLGAIDEIQKYCEMLVMKAGQLRAASVVSRQPGTKTAATPVEPSGNEQMEQPVEEEDEAEQDNDIESIREQPAPIQEYEDKENLESSKPYQRPNIRLSEATAKTKRTQLKDSLADHYPFIAFPFKVTTTVMETLHKLFEECCYQFALVHLPHYLTEQNWDCPEAVELTTWHKTFTWLVQTHPHYVFAFDTGSTFDKAVPASRRVTYVCHHLLTLKDIRNRAVHPRPINPTALPKILRRAGELARLFRDRRLQQDIQQLSSEIKRVLTALKTRRAESLKTGRTYELYHQIVADKVAIQRVRDLLGDRQISASSQEHWTPYAMFEKDIESLLEALPVAIQADEEARLDAELPPLVEMAEKMAAEVEKRNAEMQLRLEAVRKSRVDMVLGQMQFLLNMHARRMRNNSFPFVDGAETYERQGHREQQEDGKPGFGPPGLSKSSYAYRSIIRNALSQDLRREEREFEREQATADAAADAHADTTNMSAEEERFRPPGSVPSVPGEEEMWDDEAMSESESGDWGPDGYHMTTSGFFEMLEKRNKLPLEDFEQRAMKEMAAAAVQATEAEQEEGEKEEQIEAGESRRITTKADEIMIKSLNDEFEALSEENLMKKGMSRRAAGIAHIKRRLALEKKCTRQRTTISREMDLLWDERCRILDEMKALNVEIRRLKKEKKETRRAAKHQQQQQVGKNEEEEEEVDENTNEVEPEPEPTAAAVDNVVVDDSEAALNKSIRALTELATRKEEIAAKHETLKVRKRSIKTVLKKLKKLESGRSVTFIKIDHTEEPSSHLEGTDVDVDSSMDIDVELTEAEVERWRSSIVEEAVNADIKSVPLCISSGEAAMKAFRTMEEVLEEVTAGPEVTTTGDEVIPAEEVATPETSIAEPFDTESSTPIIASSAESATVASQEVSTEETALSSDLVNDTVVQNDVLLESTPVQDDPEKEATVEEMQSDEETPSLFLPTPRPPRGRALTNLALYVSRRTQSGVDVTEGLEEGAKEEQDEGVNANLKHELKEDLDEGVKKDPNEDLKEDLKDKLDVDLKDELKEDLNEIVKNELEVELKEDLNDDLNLDPKENVKDELEVELKEDLNEIVKNELNEAVKEGLKEEPVQEDVEEGEKENVNPEAEAEHTKREEEAPSQVHEKQFLQ